MSLSDKGCNSLPKCLQNNHYFLKPYPASTMSMTMTNAISMMTMPMKCTKLAMIIIDDHNNVKISKT